MEITRHFEDRLWIRFELTIDDIKKKKFKRINEFEARKMGLDSVYNVDSVLIYEDINLAIIIKDNSLLTALQVNYKEQFIKKLKL